MGSELEKTELRNRLTTLRKSYGLYRRPPPLKPYEASRYIPGPSRGSLPAALVRGRSDRGSAPDVPR